MGFLLIREIADARTAKLDQQFHRTYTRTWQVITDSNFVDAASVMIAPGIPLPYARYIIAETGVIDLAAMVTDVQPRQPDPSGAPWLWHVAVNYSTKSKDPDHENQNQADSPLDMRPNWEWGWMPGKKLFTKTADAPSKEVVNSAFEPFDPTVEIDDPRLTLVFTRNEAKFSPFDADYFMNSCNSDDFQGFSAGKVRCVEFSGKNAYAKQTPYMVVTRRFAFSDSWDVELEDVGSFSYRDAVSQNGGPDPATNPRKVPVSDSGLAIGGKVRLNGAGQLLAQNASPVYLKFRAYQRVTFADMNIPDLRP